MRKAESLANLKFNLKAWAWISGVAKRGEGSIRLRTPVDLRCRSVDDCSRLPYNARPCVVKAVMMVTPTYVCLHTTIQTCTILYTHMVAMILLTGNRARIVTHARSGGCEVEWKRRDTSTRADSLFTVHRTLLFMNSYYSCKFPNFTTDSDFSNSSYITFRINFMQFIVMEW